MGDLDLAQGGDRIAFQQLLERHYDTVYRIAYRFTGSAPDAEDIALIIHPHPSLSESVGNAAEIVAGTITDLFAPKK